MRNGKPLVSYLQGVEIDDGRIFYAVSSTDMGNEPKDDAERDTVLANVRNSIVNTSAGNALTASNTVAVSGVTGLDFTFGVRPIKPGSAIACSLPAPSWCSKWRPARWASKPRPTPTAS